MRMILGWFTSFIIVIPVDSETVLVRLCQFGGKGGGGVDEGSEGDCSELAGEQ